MVAISGFIVAHHDLLLKFKQIQARVFLLFLGPMVGLWGVYTVLGSLAENAAAMSPATYYLNLSLGILGAYCIAFRPFKNGFKPMVGVRSAK